MTDDLEDLKRRLVVRHKRDRRSVYDGAAKSELVALCLASVSRLAHECGVNANQVGRWLREHGHGRRARSAVADLTATAAAFVPVPVLPAPPTTVGSDDQMSAVMTLEVRLPHGVAIDLRDLELLNVGDVIADINCSIAAVRMSGKPDN